MLNLVQNETKKKTSATLVKNLKTSNITHITATTGEYLNDILKNNAVPFTTDFLNNKIFIAPTGTGKSYFLSHLPFAKVIVCPTIALCRNYLKYGADIFTGDTKDEKQLIKDSNFIVTTHANLANLLKVIDANLYFLCVDESHNFTASASKNFMLKDLKRTLDLSKAFIGRCFVTGTDLYNFHSEFTAMQKVIVEIPKPKKQAVIIEAKSVIQTVIDRAKESVKNNRLPVILLNDKKELLKQVTEGVKDLGFEVLNSEQKQTDFFKELTNTGNIPQGIKGIITTSVIKEGNDIYNNFDFDFYVCNVKDAIFHSIEIEQLVNRARNAKSVNVCIIKSKSRKKVEDTFYPIECMKSIKSQSLTRCNELNNTPTQYLPFEKNTQFHSNYAFVENGEI